MKYFKDGLTCKKKKEINKNNHELLFSRKLRVSFR